MDIHMHSTHFTERLRRAVLDEDGDDLLFLGNFEVEEQWAVREITLPRLTSKASAAVVNRMDEFALLLADDRSHVLLKAAPDAGYLDYLQSIGFRLPTIHVLPSQNPQQSVTQDALSCLDQMPDLSELVARGVRLLPHGVSALEEELARRSGLPLAAPGCQTSKAVNSKVYSRHLADELGLRQPEGWAASSVEELLVAGDAALSLLRGGEAVVVKEAFGVSGKGIAVVRSEQRLKRLVQLINDKAARADVAPQFVIEAWLNKATDLNYQFTVARDGGVVFDFVKEAITEGGVHRGHRIPAQLSPPQTTELLDAAAAIGKRLAEDGYFGVVGVDAILDTEGILFPILEINARNNMSTYQLPAQELLLADGQVAVAKHFDLRVTSRIAFDSVRGALEGLLVENRGATGMLINNFATVNAGLVDGSGDPEGSPGRLYVLSFASSEAGLAALDAEVAERLASVPGVRT